MFYPYSYPIFTYKAFANLVLIFSIIFKYPLFVTLEVISTLTLFISLAFSASALVSPLLAFSS